MKKVAIIAKIASLINNSHNAPMLDGNLHKLQTQAATPVAYTLRVGNESVALNPLIGKPIRLHFQGDIHCIACGRQTKKSFNQGYCFPCTRSLAQCDICIVRPEKCHYHLGTCREPAWGEAHCMQSHVVYLANSSGLKVGITRRQNIPFRWMDQGAVTALPIFSVATRYQSGLIETCLGQHIADKTNWRVMLKGNPPEVDLAHWRDKLFAECEADIAAVCEQFDADTIERLPSEEVVTFDYPVNQYPEKITSLNFDKTPQIVGVLQGIKGQYLLLDCGVLNIRKFQGYHIQFEHGG